MRPPFVYDTEADISRLQVILDMPNDTPIHLTTAIYPLPEDLKGLDNIIYLHVKPGKYIPEISDQFMDIICSLKYLETLIIERSILGGRLPNKFYELRNLKYLTIHNTWFRNEPLTEDISNFSKLESLEIRGYYKGKLPNAIGELKQLKRLIVLDTNSYLEGGSNITVPDTIWNLTNLREIRIGPGYHEEALSVDRIIELTNLEVFEFLLPVKVIPDAFWQLPNLREVHVRATEQTLVPSLAETQLTSLDLHMKLSSLPDLPATLEKFSIGSSSISELPSLKNTVIRDLSLHGQKLNTIPDLPATLEILNLDYMTIKRLPELPTLKRLVINSCYHLEELPKLPETLTFLMIGFCSKLASLPEALRLEHLWLGHCKSLPFLPSKLVVDTLIIDFCEKLDELPDDLVVLSKIQLTGMNITKMPKFPSDVTVWIHEDY